METESVNAVLENLGGIKRKLSAVVAVAEVDAAYDNAYREAGRKARVPGFRPGHVPSRIIKRMFGEDVRNDVARGLISKAWDIALKQTGAEPIGDPDIKEFDLNEGRPLTFSAEFEIRPEIILPVYTGLDIRADKEEVTEADVDRVIEDLRRKVAPVQSIAGRALAGGDIAILDFSGTADGKPIPGGSGTNFPLEIGTGTFIPGFEDALVGLAAGAEKEFYLTMPPDYPAADLAGKEAHFKVRLREIKERVLPVVDDDFARDVGEYADVAALRLRVRDNIASVREKQARSAQKQKIMDTLVGGADFELPATLTAAEEDVILRDYARRLALRGLPAEEGQKQLAEAQEDIRQVARRNVKISLILEEIARREGIKLDKADIETALNDLAERYKKPVAELRRDMIKSGSLEHFAKVLLEEKTLDWLLDKSAATSNPAPEGR